MSRLLCRAGLHRWRVRRVESTRYGAIVTKLCVRDGCDALSSEARW